MLPLPCGFVFLQTLVSVLVSSVIPIPAFVAEAHTEISVGGCDCFVPALARFGDFEFWVDFSSLVQRSRIYTMDERILDLKIRRIEQLNEKLRESLKKDRIPASRAAALIIQASEDIPDPLIPSIWHLPPELNRYRVYQEAKSMGVGKNVSCCTIVWYAGYNCWI